MGFYRDMGSVINAVIDDICENETLIKYIYYPDTKIDPLTKSVVANPKSLIYQNIFPMPKVIETEEKQRVLIMVDIQKVDPNRSGVNTTKDFVITFDIVCHIESWVIVGNKLRPFEIADELNDMFNCKYTAKSIGRLIPLTPALQKMQYNKYFMGYKMAFKGVAFDVVESRFNT